MTAPAGLSKRLADLEAKAAPPVLLANMTDDELIAGMRLILEREFPEAKTASVPRLMELMKQSNAAAAPDS